MLMVILCAKEGDMVRGFMHTRGWQMWCAVRVVSPNRRGGTWWKYTDRGFTTPPARTLPFQVHTYPDDYYNRLVSKTGWITPP